jgi:hypothetical protein
MSRLIPPDLSPEDLGRCRLICRITKTGGFATKPLNSLIKDMNSADPPTVCAGDCHPVPWSLKSSLSACVTAQPSTLQGVGEGAPAGSEALAPPLCLSTIALVGRPSSRDPSLYRHTLICAAPPSIDNFPPLSSAFSNRSAACFTPRLSGRFASSFYLATRALCSIA